MEVLGNGLGGAQFSRMSEHGVVPANDLGLEQLGSNNAIVKVDNQRATSNLHVVLLVGMGEVSELGISLLMGADDVKSERKALSSVSLVAKSSSRRFSSLGDCSAKGW